MHYDALALNCIANELEALCPGRVQQVLLVDAHSIGLEIYTGGARSQLLICADPQAPRVLQVEYKLRRGSDHETPLLLLLRKYVRDGALVSVLQPTYTERVLYLGFDHREHGPTTLVVELIGRHTNLLLLRPDGRIFECLHHVTPAAPHERLLGPGRMYTPPPGQGKLPPLDDGRPDYYELLARIVVTEGKLWKALVEGLAGVSPTAAREIAWRAAGDAEAPATQANVLAVASALQVLWQPVHTGQWEPGWAKRGDHVSGFAPYVAHVLGDFTCTATFSEALAVYYATERRSQMRPQVRPEADPYASQRANVCGLLRRTEQQLQRRLAALASDEPLPGESSRVRTTAEWLLALSSQVEPGQTTLDVALDEASPAETLHIALDPKHTPVAQAEQMFKRAARLDRAAAFIPQRRSQLLLELDYVKQLTLDLQLATNQPEITAIVDELRSAGLLASKDPRDRRSAPMRTPKAGTPLRFRSAQGLEIVVGRNARQNEYVTFDIGRADDLWLHARGVPGAHVVVRLAGRQADETTRRAAAQLAAYNSGARGEHTVDVIVTLRRWISRAPGGKPGQVLVKQEETITVPGELPDTVTELKSPPGQ